MPYEHTHTSHTLVHRMLALESPGYLFKTDSWTKLPGIQIDKITNKS